MLSGVVSSVATSVPLTREGTGVLTFGGGSSNTFGGLVTVNDGRLDLAKTGVDQAFQGNLTINSGEVRYLAGGQLPADTVVTVNSAGLFNLNGFSDIIDELNVNGGHVRTGSGGLPVSDKITSSDLVVLNGANLSVNLGFASAVGNTYTIINNAGTDVVSGQFAQGNSIRVPGPNGNITFDILYNVGNNDVVLRHANTGSAFRNRAVTPVVTEGGFATLTGTIVEPDPLDTFVLVVNWGDGSGTETHVYPPGSPRDLALRHRYLDNRPGELSSRYTIDLSWHDQHGVGNSGVLDVTVLNANPQVFAGRDVILRDGKQLSRTGFVTDAGVLDTWTATVDYGDGSGVQALSLRREGSFTLRHRYDRPGVYQVTVTVADDDGGVGRATFLVTVERDAGGRNIRAAQSGVPADSVITLLNGGEDKTEFPNPFRPGRRRLQ